MNKISHWLFPITLLAFCGPLIPILSPIFNHNTRWLFLFLLATQIIISPQKARLNVKIQLILIFIVGWNFLTYFWSEVPELSLMKAFAFFILIFTMLYAGQAWVLKFGVGKSLDCLWAVVFITFFAAVFGLKSNKISPRFQGITFNPNMMGCLIAMSSPWVLWQIYKNWVRPRKRALWLVINVLFIVCLWMTGSRASFLIEIFILGGIILAFPLKKVILLIYLTAFTVMVINIGITKPWYTWYKSDIIEKFKSDAANTIIYKWGRKNRIFFSREEHWKKSTKKAKQGGWIGGGFGVSIGAVKWKGGTLNAAGYGREKGNAQLGIIEETGIIGIILYILFIILLFSHIFSAFQKTMDIQTKIAIGLVLGLLSGLIAQSVFEAWWLAPGSPEAVIFWAVAGLGLGLAKLVRQHQNHKKTWVIRDADYHLPFR